MKKRTLNVLLPALFLFTTCGNLCFSQNYNWAIDLASGSSASVYNSAYGTSIVADANANVYVAGNYTGWLDIDPGAAFDTLNNPDPWGNFNFFVCKYSSSGNLVWGFSIGITYTGDWVDDMVIDEDANIYITGIITYAMDFDPGPAVHILDPATLGGSGFYLAKYDSAGNYVWAFTIPSTNSLNWGHALALDGSGNIIVGGKFGADADFDPSGNVATVTGPNPFENNFVAKYTQQGAYVWAFQTGFYPAVGEVWGVSVDAFDNVYVVGQTSDSTDLDPGPGITKLPTGRYVARYDANGNFDWAYGFVATGSQIDVTEVAIDHEGNIIIGGGFSSPLDVNVAGSTPLMLTSLGGEDCFIAKYDSTMQLLWAFNIGSAPNAFGERFTDLNIDASNNIYSAGVFYASMDADPGNGVHNIVANGNSFSGFTARYDPSGDFDFAFTSGSDEYSVFVSPAAFYITGLLYGTRDFDPSNSTANLTAASYDCYVAAYDLVTTGSVTTNATNDIMMYPNPAVNEVIVESYGKRIISLNLVDATGRSIAATVALPSSRVTLNSSALTPAIYFINFQLETGTTITRKLIIQK